MSGHTMNMGPLTIVITVTDAGVPTDRIAEIGFSSSAIECIEWERANPQANDRLVSTTEYDSGQCYEEVERAVLQCLTEAEADGMGAVMIPMPRFLNLWDDICLRVKSALEQHIANMRAATPRLHTVIFAFSAEPKSDMDSFATALR